MNNEKNNILLLLATVLGLSGCIPLIFTAATVTTLESAKDRTLGATLDDATISTKVKAEFIKRGLKKLYLKINVQVVQSRVLLTGSVESEDDIVSAVDIAWSVLGVREVINEIKIDENSNKFNSQQFAVDTWITGRIRTSIFFKRSIKFVNYTIVTQNGVVYVFGIARTEEELNDVTKIASEVSGVKRVVSYVHLREESAKKTFDSRDLVPESTSSSTKVEDEDLLK